MRGPVCCVTEPGAAPQPAATAASDNRRLATAAGRVASPLPRRTHDGSIRTHHHGLAVRIDRDGGDGVPCPEPESSLDPYVPAGEATAAGLLVVHLQDGLAVHVGGRPAI